VGQLCATTGDEKQYCRQHGDCQDEAFAPRGIPGVKLSGQRENNQERDDEPAVMQADSNAEDAPESDLGTHVNTSAMSCSTP
jgi:hypothetical protein